MKRLLPALAAVLVAGHLPQAQAGAGTIVETIKSCAQARGYDFKAPRDAVVRPAQPLPIPDAPLDRWIQDLLAALVQK